MRSPKDLCIHFFLLAVAAATPASAIARCFGFVQEESRLPVTPTQPHFLCLSMVVKPRMLLSCDSHAHAPVHLKQLHVPAVL